jgi:hypothetical protein
MCSACESDEDLPSSIPAVILAYDSVEIRYQQMADLVTDLISNVSVDESIRVKPIENLLDREPIVSLDFNKPVTTRKDILNFVNYQKKIDDSVKALFSQLDNDPKWNQAPLVLDFKNRYSLLTDSVQLAKRKFNETVKSAGLELSVPLDSVKYQKQVVHQ